MSDAPFYSESDVWQKLHSMPDWPDLFHVGIDMKENLLNHGVSTSLQRLRDVAWERGYTITVTDDKQWNRRLVATFTKVKR